MNSADPNITVLELVAEAIGSLREELVLVGGCSVGLLISDIARPPVRQTVDVDMVVQAVSLNEYYRTSEQLRALGFNEASDEAIMCRWKRGGLILDVLPSDQSALGHSTNPWYPAAVEFAQTYVLPSGLQIRLITAPLFVATKFEAFLGRGEGNHLHHDMEDIVNLVDGRVELMKEVTASKDDVKEYLREAFDELTTNEAFLDKLPGHFSTDATSQVRVAVVLERMRKLAGL